MKADMHVSYAYTYIYIYVYIYMCVCVCLHAYVFCSYILRQSMAIEPPSARSSAAVTNAMVVAMRHVRQRSPSLGRHHKRRTQQPLRPSTSSMTRIHCHCLRCLGSYAPMRVSRRNGSKRKLARSSMSLKANIKPSQKNVRFTNTHTVYSYMLWPEYASAHAHTINTISATLIRRTAGRI